MFKIYSTLMLSVVLCSCYSAQVHYIGSSFKPTKKVDVFVDASAIKKPYTIIGKGYVSTHYERASERMQDNAVYKAKEKGADAVLFLDVLILNDGSVVSGISRTDSVGRSSVTVSRAAINPSITSKKEILFLKYD